MQGVKKAEKDLRIVIQAIECNQIVSGIVGINEVGDGATKPLLLEWIKSTDIGAQDQRRISETSTEGDIKKFIGRSCALKSFQVLIDRSRGIDEHPSCGSLAVDQHLHQVGP